MIRRSSPIRQRLGALALFGVPLLTYPLVALPEGTAGGVPIVFIYLFGVWGAIVGAAAWVAERQAK